MEIKVGDAMPDWLVRKLSELGIYKTSFSKYGRAYTNFVQEQASANERIYVSGIAVVKNNILMNRSV